MFVVYICVQLFSSGQYWEQSYRISPLVWRGDWDEHSETCFKSYIYSMCSPYSFSSRLLPRQAALLKPCRVTLNAAQSTVACCSFLPYHDAELVQDGSERCTILSARQRPAES